MARQIYQSVLNSTARATLERLAAISQDASDKIARIVQSEAERLLSDVKSIWPIDTGFSIGQFRLFGQGAKVALINRAIYSGYVHRKGQVEPLADTVIPALAEAAARRILARAEKAVKNQAAASVAVGQILATMRRIRTAQAISTRGTGDSAISILLGSTIRGAVTRRIIGLFGSS